MKPGGDSGDFIATMGDLRRGLEDMGETILDDTYADVRLTPFPQGIRLIKKMHHRDGSCNPH